MDYNTTKWGYELTWAQTDKYSGRILIVRENEQLPYIYHKKQDITLFILQGVVKLIIEGQSKILNEGDQIHISPKIMYRIVSVRGDSTILEAGTPLEDDIVLVEE